MYLTPPTEIRESLRLPIIKRSFEESQAILSLNNLTEPCPFVSLEVFFSRTRAHAFVTGVVSSQHGC